MKRASLAAAALAVAMPPAALADHTLTHVHRSAIDSFCGTMLATADVAVSARRLGVDQDVMAATVQNAAELAFSQLSLAGADPDPAVAEALLLQFEPFGARLVSRAYEPDGHEWFAPGSTNLCVWTLNQCVRTTGYMMETVFGTLASGLVSDSWQQFNSGCQPPYNACDVDDELFLGLSLSCQGKLGNYPGF